MCRRNLGGQTYKTGPPNKRGSVLTNMCSMEKNVPSAHWQARMKFDFPLGSAVPTRVMEYVSLSLLKDYCPKGMAVSHAPMSVYYIMSEYHGCSGAGSYYSPDHDANWHGLQSGLLAINVLFRLAGDALQLMLFSHNHFRLIEYQHSTPCNMVCVAFLTMCTV